jgi:hypothetical protein
MNNLSIQTDLQNDMVKKLMAEKAAIEQELK